MNYKILEGDCSKRIGELKDNSIDCVFTSPPIFNDLGDLSTLETACKKIHRVLYDEGSLWVNVGDIRDELGYLRIWWQDFVFGMVCTGNWELVDRLIWHRPPKSAENKYNWDSQSIGRFKQDYDFILRFVKSGCLPRVYFDKTLTDAWTSSILSAAVRDVQLGETDSGFPHEIIKDCLLTTCPEGGTVLDPYCGWGSTGVVALENGMDFIGIEQDKTMIPKIKARLDKYLLRT